MLTIVHPPVADQDPRQESLLGALAWLPLYLLLLPVLYVVSAAVGIVRGVQDLFRAGSAR